MAEKVSRHLLAQFEQLRRERNGTAGLVQCAGCPEPNLVPEGREVCWRHEPVHPDAWQAYEVGPVWDVAGNL